jgi:hypothetical protein
MSRILLQMTIGDVANDWNVGRFSLLAEALQRGGHEVRNAERWLGTGMSGDNAGRATNRASV